MVTHSLFRSVALVGLAVAAPLVTGCLDPQAGTDAEVPTFQPPQQGYAPAPINAEPQRGAPQPSPYYGYPLPAAPPPAPPPPAAPLPPIPGMPGAPPPLAAPPPAALPPAPPALPPAPPPPPGREAPPPPQPEAPPPPQQQGSSFPFPLPFPFPGSSPSPIPSSGPATPIDPNIAGVASFPLGGLARREAPGMAREGVPVAANFREGQTLEQAFRMLPGRCYTVLAVGQGVSQLDLAIVAVTPLPQTSGVIARATGTNSVALGGHGDCVRWDLPIGIHAKYVLRASRGGGVAAAQLFVK